MAVRYESLATPRMVFRETSTAVEAVIRPRRTLLGIAFLAFWLCGWTVGGIAAMIHLATDFNLFVAFWLGGWAVGWICAFSALAWLLIGHEIIGITDHDLYLVHNVGFYERRRVYRGSDIRDLTVEPRHARAWSDQMSLPLLSDLKVGGISFTYGARTVYAGVDLDPAEARSVIETVAPRLSMAAAGLPELSASARHRSGST